MLSTIWATSSSARARWANASIEGRVSGTPLRDVLVEIWQANAAGRYNHPADRSSKPVDADFRAWGHAGSDINTGVYRFQTVKPGPAALTRSRVAALDVDFRVVARGINIGLSARMYFADEGTANVADPMLALIEQENRRPTLIARRSERREAGLQLRHPPAGPERDGVLRHLTAGNGVTGWAAFDRCRMSASIGCGPRGLPRIGGPHPSPAVVPAQQDSPARTGGALLCQAATIVGRRMSGEPVKRGGERAGAAESEIERNASD